MLRECFFKYHCSFVTSTLDFYWDNIRKVSFGACIANFMAKQCHLKTGINLFMSDATLQSLSKKLDHILKSKAFKIKCCQSLLNFVLFDEEHTGEFIGSWLNDAHACVQCQPSWIGSHTVYQAANAGKLVDLL